MTNSRSPKIWAIGGGKGGVGKSIICSNIALSLAEKGNKVILIDADFGAANLHTYLGIPSPKNTLSDFLLSSRNSIEKLIAVTPYKNVELIGGSEDSLKISNLKSFQINKFNESIKHLKADYILVDLGAGTTTQTIDVFIQAHKGVIVTMPEPASIENTYRFIKYSLIRKLKSVISNSGVKAYLTKLTTEKLNEPNHSPMKMIHEISCINYEAGEILKRELYGFSLKLILNGVRNNSDVRLGFSISGSCQKHFGIQIEYVGFVEMDEKLTFSSRIRKPVVIQEPFAKSSRGLKKISENLENNEQIVTSVI